MASKVSVTLSLVDSSGSLFSVFVVLNVPLVMLFAVLFITLFVLFSDVLLVELSAIIFLALNAVVLVVLSGVVCYIGCCWVSCGLGFIIIGMI